MLPVGEQIAQGRLVCPRTRQPLRVEDGWLVSANGLHRYHDTRVAHDRIFRRHGFEVVSSGACVGPTFALTDLASLYLRNYLPGRRTRRAAGKLFALLTLPLRHLDRRLVERPDAHLLASTVYSHLVKP